MHSTKSAPTAIQNFYVDCERANNKRTHTDIYPDVAHTKQTLFAFGGVLIKIYVLSVPLHQTVEELTCLATWKDGNSRYLVGLVSHHHAISNEERYRCFVYEKILTSNGEFRKYTLFFIFRHICAQFRGFHAQQKLAKLKTWLLNKEVIYALEMRILCLFTRESPITMRKAHQYQYADINHELKIIGVLVSIRTHRWKLQGRVQTGAIGWRHLQRARQCRGNYTHFVWVV